MDDIIVFSETFEQHMIDLQKVFDRLKVAGIRLHPDKCRFYQKETKFLGHVVCADGIRPDPDKVSAVMTFVAPRTLKQLCGFLGLSGYYRKFINQYTNIATPLTDLLCKDRQYIWSRACQEAFKTLKNKLCSLHSHSQNQLADPPLSPI